jgi:hypothetical protein
MMNLARIGGLALTLAFGLAVPAGAQENLERGKSPAQIYASDCAICHKSPQGLSKAGGLFGLQSFLREHYTSSRETAAALAAYLEAVDRAAPPAQRGRTTTTKRAPKTDKKPEAGEAKSGEKPGEAKPAAAPAQAKAPEAKPSEPKAEATPTEAKPAEAKPAEAKPAEAKPEPAKPEKSE